MSSKNWVKTPGHRRPGKILKRGAANRRCLHLIVGPGGESYYHATKGWRGRAAHEIGNNAAGDLYSSFIA